MTPAAHAEIEQVVDALLDIAYPRCRVCFRELLPSEWRICTLCCRLVRVMGEGEVV